MRSTSKSGNIVAGILIVILGIVFVVTTYKNEQALKTAPDFNQMDPAQIVNTEHLAGDVNLTVGYYCEETRTMCFIPIGKSRYYLVPFGKDSDKFIGVKVDKDSFDAFENLTNQTATYFDNGTSIPASIGNFKGTVRECDSKEAGYLKDFWGPDLDMSEYCVNYYIDVMSKSDKNMGVYGGLLFIIVGIISIWGGCAKTKVEVVEVVDDVTPYQASNNPYSSASGNSSSQVTPGSTSSSPYSGMGAMGGIGGMPEDTSMTDDNVTQVVEKPVRKSSLSLAPERKPEDEDNSKTPF